LRKTAIGRKEPFRRVKRDGAEDRTRTGRPCSGGGFSSHHGFHRQLFAVRALDFAFTLAIPL